MQFGVSLLLFFLIASSAIAQTVIKSNSLEVVVDLVVRDKRGRPIRDLKPDDITIQSEGKTYPVKDLRWISPLTKPTEPAAKLEANAAPPATSATSATDALKEFRFVTLLFEPIPRESARLAQEATVELIDRSAGPNLFLSVFFARERLKMVQGFTSDPALLKKAVRNVVMSAGSKQIDDMATTAENQLRSLASSGQELDQLLRGQLPQPGGRGTDAADYVKAQQARLALDTLGMADSFQRQYQGRVSLSALRGAIDALAPLPGRKTIVYICRGLGSHPSLSPVFQNLIESANAKGVTIYGIDVTGLEQSERTREAAQMLARAAAASTATLSNAGDKAVTREEAMAFETAEQSALANPTTLLAELASATGGLVLSDSNDSRRMAQQVAEDIASYWELTYSPQVESLDGSFHPIAVRVGRKGAKVQARKGFFALGPGDDKAVEPFETSLLKAISETETPTAVPFDVQLIDLPGTAGKAAGEIVVETPIGELDLEEVPAESIVRLRSGVLALLRDESGEIRQRLSQKIDWKAPLDQLEAARRGTLQWHKSFQVPPGKYTLEVALADRQSKRFGVKKIPVVIAAPAPGQLFLSAVSRIRPESAPAPAHPDWLKFNGAALTPHATAKVPLAGADAGLSFLVVIQRAEAPGPLDLELDVRLDGKSLVTLPVPLDEATRQAKGAFSYVATLPANDLEPGSYEFQFRARQDQQTASRSALLVLDPAPNYKPKPVAAPVSSAVATESVPEAPPVVLTMRTFSPVDNAPKLDAEQQRVLFEKVKETGRRWASSLINFTCLQLTDRYSDRSGDNNWKKSDTIREMVTYYNGKESYQDLIADGIFPADRPTVKAIRSFGEFGGMMRIVVGPKADPRMEWLGFVEIDGMRLHRIGYRVEQKNSGYRMTREQPFEQYASAFEGELFVEAETLSIRRITLHTQGIPERFPFQDAAHEIDYDYTRIGGQSYLLPVKSVMQTRFGKRKLARSEMTFSGYRKWASESRIQFDTGAPQP